MNRAAHLLILLAIFGSTVAMAPKQGSEGGRTPTRVDYRRPAEIPYPSQNPYSLAKEELGRALFFDPRLSNSRSVSCASCHDPDRSWGDGLPRAIGEAHTPLSFRSPTLLNVAWTETLGWDGKFQNLEAVAYAPITAEANMNMTEDKVSERLRASPGYVDLFAKVFADGAISRKNIELALATFQRSIVSANGPFDDWVAGNEDAISASAKRGFEVFNVKARCSDCHSGWAFTDGSFHDIGTAQGDDIGRGRIFTSSTKLRYAFKTPTLRNVAQRAPYMHDGSVPSLEKVVELYDRGGVDRPSRSESIKPLNLSPQEKADLIAFLQSLTSPPQRAQLPDLPE